MSNSRVLKPVYRTEIGICLFGWWVPIYRKTYYEQEVSIGYGTAHKQQKSEVTDELV